MRRLTRLRDSVPSHSLSRSLSRADFGNYQCRDGAVNHSDPSPVDWVKLVAGSVKAIADYGFDSVKLDSGFPVGSNLTLWAELLNKTGRPVMVENCHQGGDGPGSVRDAAQIHGKSNPPATELMFFYGDHQSTTQLSFYMGNCLSQHKFAK